MHCSIFFLFVNIYYRISSSSETPTITPALTPSHSAIFKVPDPIDINNRRPSNVSSTQLSSSDSEARRGSITDSDYSSNVFSAEKNNSEQNSELNDVFFVSKPSRPAFTPSVRRDNLSVDEMIAQRRAQLMQNSNK